MHGWWQMVGMALGPLLLGASREYYGEVVFFARNHRRMHDTSFI